MASAHMTTSMVILALLASFASAYDPNPLQDYCVAAPDAQSAVFVNGKVCKNPKFVKSDDFYISAGLHNPVKSIPVLGIAPNVVDVNRWPALNTMGLSFGRVDFEPNGLLPPHTHPRSSESVVVMQGTVLVGFLTSSPVSSNQRSTLFTKTLKPGDAFVLPKGLIHFLFNFGPTKAVIIAVYNSQNPGISLIANTLFGSNPPIPDDVLTKTFTLDKNVISRLKSSFNSSLI